MGFGSERVIENAIIESTQLGYMDHGILSAWLSLKMDGTGQGFGGYGLDGYNKKTKGRLHGPHCGAFIEGVLTTVGVEKWEDLKGKHVRIDRDWSKVYRIGHIIEDRWFDPGAVFEALDEKQPAK